MSGPITTAMENIRGLWSIHAPVFLAMPNEPEGRRSSLGGANRRFSSDERSLIMDRLRQGHSPYAIGRDMGCCESKVRYYKGKL